MYWIWINGLNWGIVLLHTAFFSFAMKNGFVWILIVSLRQTTLWKWVAYKSLEAYWDPNSYKVSCLLPPAESGSLPPSPSSHADVPFRLSVLTTPGRVRFSWKEGPARWQRQGLGLSQTGWVQNPEFTRHVGRAVVGVCGERPPSLPVAGTGARAQSCAVIWILRLPCWGRVIGRPLGKSVCQFLVKSCKHFLQEPLFYTWMFPAPLLITPWHVHPEASECVHWGRAV